MALPYQYRDYPLAIFMAIVVLVAGTWELCVGGSQFVQVALAESCCEKQSCPTVNALIALPFATDVQHRSMQGANMICLRTDRNVSAQQIWDVLEQIDRRPARLIVNNREFVARPAR